MVANTKNLTIQLKNYILHRSLAGGWNAKKKLSLLLPEQYMPQCPSTSFKMTNLPHSGWNSVPELDQDAGQTVPDFPCSACEQIRCQKTFDNNKR